MIAPNHRWDVTAAEVAAALREAVKANGIPSRANMTGVPTLEGATALHDELVKRSERLTRSWGERLKRPVRLRVSVYPGRTIDRGWDVTFSVDWDSKSTIVTP